jgi:histidinol dehydrogenase
MNKIYEPKPNTWSAILERTKTVDDIELTVKEILKKFRKRGGCSQIYFDFDGVTLRI